ncbi:MAG: S41 family peptidase [Anaerolineales bacterium]|nr:S41 family peptidase [Anaerolineales bacterium]
MDNKKRKRFPYLVLRTLFVITICTSAFIAGYIARSPQQETNTAQAQTDTNKPFTLLQEVDRLVEDNFYKDVPSATTREYAAIRGYLDALEDPYSFFSDPPVTQNQSDSLAGRYGGIGVDVKRNEAGLIELYPYPESPALAAGVLNGDILVAINDQMLNPTERLDIIQQMLRGEVTDEGNGVSITVEQPDGTNQHTIEIPFAEIRIPSVIWRVISGQPSFGYIQITSFTSRTPDELNDAMMGLADQNIAALILDLRDNSGGLLQESIQIADAFLDGGTIVIEKSRKSGEKNEVATAGDIAAGLPIAIIVNGRTASASEVVAGALQQNRRGFVIGQRTRGKGSVQFIFGLSDGSSIRITAAIWLTPDGTPLDGIGLSPDIEMIPDENGRDVELGEAVRQLSQLLVTES